jgi:hypothetical protein
MDLNVNTVAPGRLSEALENLDDALSELGELSGGLLVRVEPLLAPPAPSPSGTSVADSGVLDTSAVVSRLLDATSKVGHIKRTIQDMHERITL